MQERVQFALYVTKRPTFVVAAPESLKSLIKEIEQEKIDVPLIPQDKTILIIGAIGALLVIALMYLNINE